NRMNGKPQTLGSSRIRTLGAVSSSQTRKAVIDSPLASTGRYRGPRARGLSFLAALPDRRPRSQYKRAALRATRKATRHLSRMTRLTRFLRMDNVRGSVLMVASMAGFAVEDVLIKQM